MELWFRYFLEMNFPAVNEGVDEEHCELLYHLFKEYLTIKCPHDIRYKIWPDGYEEVFLNLGNPLKKKGFEPELLTYFIMFIEDEKAKI